MPMTAEERRARLLETKGATWVAHADKITLHSQGVPEGDGMRYWAVCAEHGLLAPSTRKIEARTEDVRRHLNGLT